MLRLGATTFWERFDPQWEDSGCLQIDDPPVNAMNQDTSMSHPWATGATSFLSAHALGLRAAAPGFASWLALPLLLDNSTTGLSWVKGSMPTPHGALSAEFDLRTGVFEVIAPSGCEDGMLGIPKLGRGVAAVLETTAEAVDEAGDSAAWAWANSTTGLLEQTQQTHGTQPDQLEVKEDGQWLYIVGLKPGRHRFLVEHNAAHVSREAVAQAEDGTESVPTLLPSLRPLPSGKWDPNNTDFDYEATYHGIDSTTGGSWVGKYGSKGYVLFNYSADAEDVSKQDPRIRSVDAGEKRHSFLNLPYDS